ncbi:hypothetical protein ABPG75_006562 [Micractinium tetrahymenae]
MAALAPSSSLQRCFSSSSRVAAPRRASVAVRADLSNAAPSVKPPKGVTLPPTKPAVPPSNFGFVESAERLNSRAAMIGFFALLLVELVAGQGLLDLLGFTTGNGLGFEF